MCESNAYVRRGDTEELILQEVATIERIEGGYRLRSLFGEEAEVRGKIQEINLLKHKVLFSEE
ncbi:MAG: CooT family nickel-binding protein [Deferrisomatales bacterium]